MLKRKTLKQYYIMGAPKGNEFWKARSKHGRDKIFSSPKALWNAANEYFQWNTDNPLYTNEVVRTGQDAGKLLPIPLMRAMTLDGLCTFLDIDTDTFRNYATKEEYKDFFDVSTRIRQIIDDQKFQGAAAGMLNANIIARDLGLTDKKDLSSSDGSMTPQPTIIVKEELKDQLDKL